MIANRGLFQLARWELMVVRPGLDRTNALESWEVGAMPQYAQHVIEILTSDSSHSLDERGQTYVSDLLVF